MIYPPTRGKEPSGWAGGSHIISEVSVLSERDGIFGCGSYNFLSFSAAGIVQVQVPPAYRECVAHVL